MAAIELTPLAPQEALRFFRAKGYRIGFAWQDVWQSEHSRAFTVAKAMRLDILQDIRAAVDRALANGTTLAQFQKELTPILQAKGWWGRQAATDPLTGERKIVQLGSPRRLRTIFDVNLRTSYAAGRWEQVQRTKRARPYLRYSAILDDRTRPEHAAWHGTILPADDPWWETHYPPNGWNCRCTAIQLSDRDLEREGWKVDEKPPPGGTSTYRNPRTGETVDVPDGVDPGFGYNVGTEYWRALTPPPNPTILDLPIISPPAKVPPLPAPRSAPASRLLSPGLAETAYLDRFLREFGATRAKPAVFVDKIGEPVVIGQELFRRPDGTLKATKRGRERSLLLLADTIKEPDEIWWQWRDTAAGPALFRIYVARWSIGDRDRNAFSMFAIGRAGWEGVTAFDPRALGYLDRQRFGTLAWRRP